MHGFEILVDGVRRTFRDVEKIALVAARQLKRKNLKSEITTANTKSGEWAIVTDIASDAVIWHPAPGRVAGTSPQIASFLTGMALGPTLKVHREQVPADSRDRRPFLLLPRGTTKGRHSTGGLLFELRGAPTVRTTVRRPQRNSLALCLAANGGFRTLKLHAEHTCRRVLLGETAKLSNVAVGPWLTEFAFVFGAGLVRSLLADGRSGTFPSR